MKIPLYALICEAIGALLLGLGIAAVFADVHVLPAALRFAGYEFVFIAAGAILGVPLFISIVGLRKP